jgi:hypothetical protein
MAIAQGSCRDSSERRTFPFNSFMLSEKTSFSLLWLQLLKNTEKHTNKKYADNFVFIVLNFTSTSWDILNSQRKDHQKNLCYDLEI